VSKQVILDQPPPAGRSAPPEDNGAYDLVDGVWVEKTMGAKSSRVGVLVAYRLGAFNETKPSGLFFGTDCGYKIFPHNPKLVRYPDVSFVRFGRLPNDEIPEGYMTIAPDLVVEVVSPKNLAEEVEERLLDFLRVGVPLIWVLYPRSRSVYVVRQDGTARHLTGSEELLGDDVLPGFRCRVDQLFPDQAP